MPKYSFTFAGDTLAEVAAAAQLFVISVTGPSEDAAPAPTPAKAPKAPKAPAAEKPAPASTPAPAAPTKAAITIEDIRLAVPKAVAKDRAKVFALMAEYGVDVAKGQKVGDVLPVEKYAEFYDRTMALAEAA